MIWALVEESFCKALISGSGQIILLIHCNHKLPTSLIKSPTGNYPRQNLNRSCRGKLLQGLFQCNPIYTIIPNSISFFSFIFPIISHIWATWKTTKKLTWGKKGSPYSPISTKVFYIYILIIMYKLYPCRYIL